MKKFLEGGHRLGTEGLKMPSLACLILHVSACRDGFEPSLSKVKKNYTHAKRKMPTFLFLSYKFMLVWFELVRVVHYGAGREETF